MVRLWDRAARASSHVPYPALMQSSLDAGQKTMTMENSGVRYEHLYPQSTTSRTIVNARPPPPPHQEGRYTDEQASNVLLRPQRFVHSWPVCSSLVREWRTTAQCSARRDTIIELAPDEIAGRVEEAKHSNRAIMPAVSGRVVLFPRRQYGCTDCVSSASPTFPTIVIHRIVPLSCLY